MTRFDHSGPLRGALRPPGDKSISHRAALIAAMGDGETAIESYLDSADTRSTLAAVEALGAEVEGVTDTALAPTIRIGGVGLRGADPARIDVGNAGTLLRLLPGWLAGQEAGAWTLDGDDSIRRRPVDRVVAPLRQMGARLSCREGRLPPLEIEGAPLHGISYEPADGKRPGQVLPALCRAARRGRNPCDRAACDPRPHGAHARCRRR